MKKLFRTTLKTLGIILVILIVGGLLGWWYLSSQFLSFEDDYTEKKEIPELTIEGYTFLDRNENGALDVYEDDRASIAARVEDLLSQMTVEDKIHILKG